MISGMVAYVSRSAARRGLPSEGVSGPSRPAACYGIWTYVDCNLVTSTYFRGLFPEMVYRMSGTAARRGRRPVEDSGLTKPTTCFGLWTTMTCSLLASTDWRGLLPAMVYYTLFHRSMHLTLKVDL